ncbi:glycoside hydrolase family 128 protein [Zasmidium cellare ATCC 36951]|uniref:Glycoside hydrolase family 128 protein n=1 Tax=Zasmidium cellare ATCC 36951 TaxID=1080233 RepID=A0A6A6D3Y2_ZASCE|nr:glycoside hydrolase family 128 protein [Zasmidium cellare ATCC 36951]KAF2172849.1 glycoside hydrolase family 128 protein [Zasmidium cellare ATCC 36951]
MNSNSKRGLCWPVENHPQDQVLPWTKPGSKVSWIYNWSPTPTPSSPSSLVFVPMQWNAHEISSLPRKVEESRSDTVILFNEPELPDQANMSAATCAQEWLTHIEPLRRRGVRCGSPGISCAGHAVGWLREFWGLVRDGGGDVDFWCLHWYGETLGQFYDYIWSTHHQLDPTKPVWITEFAATNWNSDNPLPRDHVESFARESVKYLDTLDWVERYAWFGPMRDTGTVGRWARMLDDEGKLTELGKAYRDG